MIDVAAQAHRVARMGLVPRWLFWVESKNRTTGLTETMGLWTGDQDEAFMIDGASRDYLSASVVGFPSLTFGSGLGIQMQTLTLGPISPEVELLLYGYDPRLAPVEVHLVSLDPDTHNTIAIERLYKGWIDEAPVKTDPLGGQKICEVSLAGSARGGTRTLSTKKSDAAQSLRGGDRFRRHADVVSSTNYWGENGPAVAAVNSGNSVGRPRDRDGDVGGHSDTSGSGGYNGAW